MLYKFDINHIKKFIELQIFMENEDIHDKKKRSVILNYIKNIVQKSTHHEPYVVLRLSEKIRDFIISLETSSVKRNFHNNIN